MGLWLAGLSIGALFGFAWGWTAGQRSVVILPAETDPLSEPSQTARN